MLARLTQLPLLVVLLAITGGLTFLPAAHALVLRQHGVAQDFFYSGLIILIGAVMIGIATLSHLPRNAGRSHLTALVAAYLVLPVVMALPILQTLPDTSFVNAWFEMMSAFTTTGASLYDPARLPPSVHLWRGMVGWFGGFFILLAAYAILAPLNLGGVEVISGRVPGRGTQGAAQITRVADPGARLGRYAIRLFPVYAGLTHDAVGWPADCRLACVGGIVSGHGHSVHLGHHGGGCGRGGSARCAGRRADLCLSVPVGQPPPACLHQALSIAAFPSGKTPNCGWC